MASTNNFNFKDTKALREETISELNTTLENLLRERLRLRMKKANGTLEKTHDFKVIRRSIARILTILAEKSRQEKIT